MKAKKFWLFALLALVAYFLFTKRKQIAVFTYLAQIFKQFEGFRSTPYWDYGQWSWGYGTKVPGSSESADVKPLGTITRAQAMIDSFDHVTNDQKVLAPLLKVSLSNKQWAAVLSFTYNCGQGPGKILVGVINDLYQGEIDYQAVEYKMKQYVKDTQPGGVVVTLPGLVTRREFEFNLFKS